METGGRRKAASDIQTVEGSSLHAASLLILCFGRQNRSRRLSPAQTEEEMNTSCASSAGVCALQDSKDTSGGNKQIEPDNTSAQMY